MQEIKSCVGWILGILTCCALFICFCPDEEWKGVSPNRHCWFYSEVTYYTSKKDTSFTIYFALGCIQLIFSIIFWHYLQKKLTCRHFFYSLQVAAFRATLEEISESSLLVHVIDIRLYISRRSRSHFIYGEKEFRRTRQLLVLICNISHQLFSWIAVIPWPSNR